MPIAYASGRTRACAPPTRRRTRAHRSSSTYVIVYCLVLHLIRIVFSIMLYYEATVPLQLRLGGSRPRPPPVWSIYLYLSIYLSIYLVIYLSLSLSLYAYIYIYICIYIYMYIYIYYFINDRVHNANQPCQSARHMTHAMRLRTLPDMVYRI